MSSKPILGYWDFRGRAEPIRLIFKYAGVDFEDKRYKGSQWSDVKFNLGFDFPNIPYLIDGDVKLTQSIAIGRYLARKYALDGSTEAEKNRLAVFEQQFVDLFASYVQFAFVKKNATAEETAQFVANVETQLELVNKALSDGKYIIGDSVSYVDFFLYEYLNSINSTKVASGIVSKYDALKQFVQRIEALPQLTDYLAQLNAK